MAKPRLTIEEEAFGMVFWGHVSRCDACKLLLSDAAEALKVAEAAGQDGMSMREFASKLCREARELVYGFEKLQKRP